MADPVAFDIAVLYGILFECMFYGLYLAVFGVTMYVLFMPVFSPRTARQERVNVVLLSTAILLFLSLTVHFCINMARIYGAYVVHGAEPYGPILFFANLKSPLALVWAACYVFEAFITDSLTIYRLYVIWGSNIWVCIAPGLCVAAMLVSGFGTVVAFSKLSSGNELWTNVAGDWLICSFVLGLATNVLAVSLIGYRILIRDRNIAAIGGSGSLKNVIIVIIESAALYTFLKTINLVLLLTKSNVAWAFLSIANPIIGIASHLLILRVAWMRHFKPAMTASSMTAPSRGGAYPMRVQVTTDRVNDDDLEASTMKGGDDKLARSGNW